MSQNGVHNREQAIAFGLIATDAAICFFPDFSR